MTERGARARRDRGRDGAGWRSARGQALSEYVVMLGFIVATVIAAMAMFVAPVAGVIVRLARHIVVNLTG